MKYIKPTDQSDPNAPFVDANPSIGQDGSIVPAHAIEHPQREIVYVIVQAGLTPNEADLTQLYQAIQNLIAAGGGGGGGAGAYLPLAGGTMDANANANFVGTGVVKINGADVWHPGNDGPGSGLDADTVDGVQAAALAKNNSNDEPIANGKVRFRRLTTASNAGIIVVKGKDSLLGGGRIYFETDAGAVSAEITLDDDRRTTRGKMWSDAGLTYEDQFRFLDSGELWLRKLNAAAIASGNVAQAIIALQGVTGDGNTGPLNGTGIGAYVVTGGVGYASAPLPVYGGTWINRGLIGPWVDGGGSWAMGLWQRVA